MNPADRRYFKVMRRLAQAARVQMLGAEIAERCPLPSDEQWPNTDYWRTAQAVYRELITIDGE